jgi:hypothetical protein
VKLPESRAVSIPMGPSGGPGPEPHELAVAD